MGPGNCSDGSEKRIMQELIAVNDEMQFRLKAAAEKLSLIEWRNYSQFVSEKFIAVS